MSQSRRTFLLAAPATLAGWHAFATARPGAAWEASIPLCTSASYVQRGPADADADLLEKLGLLEGHLIVGRRLLEAGESRLAVPHFGHPIRELYTWLEPRLAARRAAGFEAELEAMEAHAEGGQTSTGGRFGPAYATAMERLAAARGTVPAAKRGDPRFMLGHLALMVYNVASDYGESIERGRIVNIVEYHDSLGFLAYARRVAESGPQWREAAAEIVALEGEAYPRLMPSPRPNISISAARARALRVQALADAA